MNQYFTYTVQIPRISWKREKTKEIKLSMMSLSIWDLVDNYFVLRLDYVKSVFPYNKYIQTFLVLKLSLQTTT